MLDEIPLFCITDGDATPFCVDILPTKTIDHLKTAIKEKRKPRFDDIAADELTLFQINVPSSPKRPIKLDRLTSQGINPQELDPTSGISELYEGDPPKKTIHILVQKSGTTGVVTSASVAGTSFLGKLPRFRSPSPPQDPDELKRQKLFLTREQSFKAGIDTSSPSSAAKPSQFSKQQEKNPILNGRPFAKTGPPIALFHTVFGEFLRDINDVNLPLTDYRIKLAEDFLWASADLYKDENARMTTIREILGKIVGDIVDAVCGGSDSRSNGVLLTSVGDQRAYRMILEGKNEVGAGGCDPTVQLAQYYRTYWSQTNTELFRDNCCCPTFGIAIAGPWMCIIGAVYLDVPVVQPLTPFVPLTSTPYHNASLSYIARVLEALRLGLTRLENFYSQRPNGNNRAQLLFPHLRSFTAANGTVTWFDYESQLTEERTRLVWKAKINDGTARVIVVKFTHRYDYAAHGLCATNKLAPRLLHFGGGTNDFSLAGLHVIIMEYISPCPLETTLVKDYSRQERQRFFQDIRQAITLLHSNGYVFGDLRIPNILVHKRNGGYHAMLIDFEWGGLQGATQYPPSISRTINWPHGVLRSGAIVMAHDIALLNELQALLEI
ncbi:hypothetical protein BGZ76_009319 [Entomortierella beljakovae]|nr:hypothetical protein BGZ76_009319 [Entomortierella beljakovae]